MTQFHVWSLQQVRGGGGGRWRRERQRGVFVGVVRGGLPQLRHAGPPAVPLRLHGRRLRARLRATVPRRLDQVRRRATLRQRDRLRQPPLPAGRARHVPGHVPPVHADRRPQLPGRLRPGRSRTPAQSPVGSHEEPRGSDARVCRGPSRSRRRLRPQPCAVTLRAQWRFRAGAGREEGGGGGAQASGVTIIFAPPHRQT